MIITASSLVVGQSDLYYQSAIQAAQVWATIGSSMTDDEEFVFYIGSKGEEVNP